MITFSLILLTFGIILMVYGVKKTYQQWKYGKKSGYRPCGLPCYRSFK